MKIVPLRINALIIKNLKASGNENHPGKQRRYSQGIF